MIMSATYETRIKMRESALENIIDEWNEQEEDDEDEEEEEEEDTEFTKEEKRKKIKQAFLAILTQLTQVIRDADGANYEGLPLLVENVDRLLYQASLFANDDDNGGPYGGGHMPSYAHNSDARFITDTSRENRLPYGLMSKMMPFLRKLHEDFGPGEFKDPDEIDIEQFFHPPPWKQTPRPNPLSTLCSRFRDPVWDWKITDTNHRATSVFQARCEITSGDIHNPIDMALSSNGDMLALSSMGGWKARTPYLWYYHLNHEDDYDFIKKRSIKVDLTSFLDTILLVEDRNLLFVADHMRIRSYHYTLPTESQKARRIHTMNCSKYTGPLAMLGDGRLLRAGDRDVAVWELDTLQTHGESGKDIIGERIVQHDTWRDDPEEIEPSTGSATSATIQLEGHKSDNGGPQIKNWSQHPSNGNVMLCGMDVESANNYCHSYDFQAGGRIVSRYLGHGGTVEGFSIAAGDPHVFLTRCSDGHARIYDVRHPLPVMTITAGNQLLPIEAAVLAIPDGLSFVFTSTAEHEDIKLWDVRARALVYELATGNNVVQAMSWDAASNTLYAASRCENVDRNGRHMDYRTAKIPRLTGRDSNDENMNVDETEYFEESEDSCWPSRAYHAEDYFGHVFDAGDHRLYKFSFKMDPDMEKLPYYGSASLSSGSVF